VKFIYKIKNKNTSIIKINTRKSIPILKDKLRNMSTQLLTIFRSFHISLLYLKMIEEWCRYHVRLEKLTTYRFKLPKNRTILRTTSSTNIRRHTFPSHI